MTDLARIDSVFVPVGFTFYVLTERRCQDRMMFELHPHHRCLKMLAESRLPENHNY